MSAEYKIPGINFSLGSSADAFRKAIEKAKADRLVERIWQRDYTVWGQTPDEISNRLGWLDIAERMRAEVPALEQFAKDLKSEGFTHALLLGMGGSSLAPELFGQLFGKKDGLQLSVLDSTDPDAVRAAAERFAPKRTLYIVSTKSGGTIETLSFFKYFYNQAQKLLGGKTGSHFIAITDPGSSLVTLAKKYSFRHVFLADPNVGGRYSVLSNFGLVPAALVGVDLSKLLYRVETAAKHCQEEAIDKNPGALLGLALGTLAAAGRDKATFVMPKEIADFGNWVEQLIAESTGKQGKGILPVIGEALADARDYGPDRVFIEIGKIESIDKVRNPIINMECEDIYDLGGQFFLWEFATAVAGYVMGINPFDQPNVEAAKLQARVFVDAYSKSGKLPKGEGIPLDEQTLKIFLRKSQPGDYFALQAYAAPSPDLTSTLDELRTGIMKKHKAATTLGYGPRFLHSTGQLHKGDAGNGLFIQFVTTPPTDDVPIPKEAGKPESEISFGVLKVAQALGDAQALRAAGRRVLTFEVAGDLNSALIKLIADL
jgi:glucose-6-phosphate isomerase